MKISIYFPFYKKYIKSVIYNNNKSKFKVFNEVFEIKAPRDSIKGFVISECNLLTIV